MKHRLKRSTTQQKNKRRFSTRQQIYSSSEVEKINLLARSNSTLRAHQHTLQQIHTLLIQNKQTLAVAESCTGGLLSKLLTDLPGSSRYFLLGIAAYSNSAKKKLLKIPVALLAKKGAVSQEVAAALAANIRGIANADLGIGITGIAGPAGGTARKPVGTVFIAAANRRKVICEEFRFSGNRGAIRKQAALKALELLKRLLS